MAQALDFTAIRSIRPGRAFAILLMGLLMAGFQGGCGRGPSSEASRASTGNAALDAALRREVAVEGDFFVETASKDFTARVGLRPTLAADEGIQEIAMQLPGDGGGISCFVYEGEGDVGGSALRLSYAGIELLEEQGIDFQIKKVNGFYAGVAGGVAYHGIEWLLAGSTGSAQPKAMAANKHGRGLACLHLNLGFGQTFEGVFVDLLESFSVPTPPPGPYFTEIVVSSLGGLEVGVESMQLILDEDGDTEVRTAGSLLLPVSPEEVVATISTGLSWSRPDGTLINARVWEANEADQHTNLSLSWADDAGWRASGTFQGKDLDALLPHTGPIDTKLREVVIMTSLLEPKGDQTAAEMVEWVPDIDPTNVTRSMITTLPDDPLQIHVDAAGISFDAVRGEEGHLDTAKFALGSSTVETKVIYREGSF